MYLLLLVGKWFKVIQHSFLYVLCVCTLYVCYTLCTTVLNIIFRILRNVRLSQIAYVHYLLQISSKN